MSASHFPRQKGATLLVTMVALIVVTFLALAAIRGGLTNLRIAGNTQSVVEAQSLAQAKIDSMIANMATFTSAPSTTTSETLSVGGTSHSQFGVTVDMPRCLDSRPVKGYSEVVTGGSSITSSATQTLQQGSATAPLEQLWDFAAAATDSFSGTSVTVHQGIRIRMSSDTVCPNGW